MDFKASSDVVKPLQGERTKVIGYMYNVYIWAAPEYVGSPIIRDSRQSGLNFVPVGSDRK